VLTARQAGSSDHEIARSLARSGQRRPGAHPSRVRRRMVRATDQLSRPDRGLVDRMIVIREERQPQFVHD
jgi:hypothetical protein